MFSAIDIMLLMLSCEPDETWYLKKKRISVCKSMANLVSNESYSLIIYIYIYIWLIKSSHRFLRRWSWNKSHFSKVTIVTAEEPASLYLPSFDRGARRSEGARELNIATFVAALLQTLESKTYNCPNGHGFNWKFTLNHRWHRFASCPTAAPPFVLLMSWRGILDHTVLHCCQWAAGGAAGKVAN